MNIYLTMDHRSAPEPQKHLFKTYPSAKKSEPKQMTSEEH